MEVANHYLPIASTGFFSAIATDYVQENQQLRQFYQHSVSLDGIKAAIDARKQAQNHRELLHSVLLEQYKGLQLSSTQQNNLAAILNQNTFTVTTAHQPNIFTGPLYFVYKILHAVQQANYLKWQLPEYHFVPFYYMGSEDADLDELGNITIDGRKLFWQTQQTGAVGRMKVDKAFLQLITEVKGRIGVLPFGKELSALFENAYTLGKSIQQATLELVHYLFAEFGLLVLIPDNARLKKVFEPIVLKELTEQFSHKAVEQTIQNLQLHYLIQTQGRPINLFYLMDTYRERIEWENGLFVIKKAGLSFTRAAIIEELQQHPERFSGNVILRGLFQETVLPNVQFIGGGGELAYWLELKQVFQEAGVPYPMLLLRNSFIIIEKKLLTNWRELGFQLHDLFKSILILQGDFIKKNSTAILSLQNEIAQLQEVYHQILEHAVKVDITLEKHVKALQHNAIEKIVSLEKKMTRAEKRKFATDIQRIEKIKNKIFPNQQLQERVENFSLFYAQYGPDLLQYLYKASRGFGQEMCIMALD